MARPLRIEYPDAWYHVMNRGRRGEAIFSDEQDYAMFTEVLKETSEMWNIRVAAYCLMPNHYHRVHTRFLTAPVFARKPLAFKVILTVNELGERRFRHFCASK